MNEKLKNNKEERVISLESDLFKIEERKEGDPEIVFYPAVFNRWSEDLGWFREQISPGAFDEVLEDDVRALFNHDSNYVLGRTKSGTLKLEQNQRGLKATVVPPDAQWAKDLVASIKRGDISQASFAFSVREDKWKFSTDPGVPDERTILKIERLYDVSPVTYPAYEQTSVWVRSKAEEIHKQRRAEFERQRKIEEPLAKLEPAEEREFILTTLDLEQAEIEARQGEKNFTLDK